MNLIKMSNDEILRIADPIWDNIVDGTNNMNYEVFSKDFSKSYLERLTEERTKEQWDSNPVLSSLTKEREYITCLRRDSKVNILWKQASTKLEGDFLAILMLCEEKDEIKVFGTRIF